MKLLTDRTPERQFDDFSRGIIEQIKTRKISQRVAQQKIMSHIIAHKKMEGQRKKLIYVEVGPLLHLVTNGNFTEYCKLRRDIPDRVILFSTRRELVEEVESRGFLV